MLNLHSYFGVLNPHKFLPERCTFGREFSCQDSQITFNDVDTASVSLYLVNNKGFAVNVHNFEISNELGDILDSDNDAECTVATLDTVADNLMWKSGEAIEFVCKDFDTTTNGFFPQGTKGKINVVVTFKKIGGKYPSQVLGEVYETVLAQ